MNNKPPPIPPPNQYTIIGKKRNNPFKMCYKIYGTGEQKIIQIQGCLSKIKYGEKIANYFLNNPNYSICLYDHCGVGESETTNVSTISDLASDALELIEHLKWDKVNIIGGSMGAQIAYELSLMAPNRINTLSLFCQPEASKFLNSTLFIHFFLLPWIDIKFFKKEPAYVVTNTLFGQSFLNAPSKTIQGPNREFVTPLMNNLYNDVSNYSIKTIIQYLVAVFLYKTKPSYKDKSDLLKRPFPIIMFLGTKDRLHHWKTTIKTYETIQPNKIFICKGAGHSLQTEDFDVFIKHINQIITNNYNNKKLNNNKKEFLVQEELEFSSNEKPYYHKTIDKNPFAYRSKPFTQLFKNFKLFRFIIRK